MMIQLENKVDAIIFDLDGTLSPYPAFWDHICHELEIPIKRIRKIYSDCLNKKKSVEQGVKEVVNLLQGSRKTNQGFFRRITEKWIYRDEAEDTISYLNSKKYKLCIISGAFKQLVIATGKRFGIKDLYHTTEFIWDDSRELVDIKYELDQETKKVEYLNDFISNHHFTKSRCAVVADGDNDIKLFKECGYKILIGDKVPPDLKQLSFTQIKNLNELKHIF